ncbi:MAG: hypothetical protein ABSH56_19085 [Bryobacteraceae bacterium]|jgi:hypothetical protein
MKLPDDAQSRRTAEQIIARAREMKEAFGAKCSKFAGALSVELVRQALAEAGIATSARDVFVRGVPIEVDLIIPHRGQGPLLGGMYEPQQVAVALEVKNSGSFGEATILKVRSDFERLHMVGVAYAYLTLEERRGYRWAISSERIGCRCFTLGWHKAATGPFEATTEWGQLLLFLENCLGGGARSAEAAKV